MAGALAGKENAAAEDAAALVTRGTALVGDCAGLESLGRQCAQARAARAPPPKDGELLVRRLPGGWRLGKGRATWLSFSLCSCD